MDRLQMFQLFVEEVAGVILEEEDLVYSKGSCERSLVGKIFGEKRINFVGLRNTMTAIWPTKEPIKVRELGFNLFQFVFNTLEDLRRVVRGKVWTFDQQYLILKEWKEGVNIQKETFNISDGWKETFNTIETWVQIWNLPTHWMSKEVGVKIGKLFLWVSDVLIPKL